VTRWERWQAAIAQLRSADTLQGCDDSGKRLEQRNAKQIRIDQHAAMMRAANILAPGYYWRKRKPKSEKT
jgi:hypothetical protein